MQRSYIQHPEVVRGPQDDWSTITEREERKKRQNRLNQRARRLRNEKQTVQSYPSQRKPYLVDRWRAKAIAPHLSSPKSSSNPEASLDSLEGPRQDEIVGFKSDFEDMETILHMHPYLVLKPAISYTPPSLDFRLSSDHLLIHLIHYNVFRALTANKKILASRAVLTKPTDQGFISLLPSFADFCDGLTLIKPQEDVDLPQFLYPTLSQMKTPHSSWINMFPFSRFRDNLIELEGVFDAYDLCNDLFGEMFTNTSYPQPIESSISKPTSSEVGIDDDGLVSGRRGLIAWGEPWDKRGWEVTPGFVRKWAWLMKGCEDMIEAGNWWRAKRDEEPLPLITEFDFGMPVLGSA